VAEFARHYWPSSSDTPRFGYGQRVAEGNSARARPGNRQIGWVSTGIVRALGLAMRKLNDRLTTAAGRG
jgi:hypothetical protein